MKKLLIVLTVLVIFVSGCKEESSPQFYEAYVGSILSVDGNGVFSEDVIYTKAYSTMSYKSDGTFEILRYDHEGSSDDYNNNGTLGEGWILTSGERGTYSYDPVTFVLTSHMTSYYSNAEDANGNQIIDGGMVWFTPTSTNEKTSLVLMTQHTRSDIYKKSESGSYVFKESDEWFNEDGDLEWRWSSSESITLSESSLTIYKADYSEPRWSDFYSEPYMNYEHNQVGTIVSRNGDDVIQDGSYTTFHVRYTTDIRKWWEYDGADGSVYSSGVSDESDFGNTERMTYIGIEDCLFRLDPEWSRQAE